jgi:hypothetical protein
LAELLLSTQLVRTGLLLMLTRPPPSLVAELPLMRQLLRLGLLPKL